MLRILQRQAPLTSSSYWPIHLFFSNRKGKNMWDHNCQQKGCQREMMMVSFLNMNTTYSILSHITKCTCVRIDDRWRTHIDGPDNWILHLFGTCLLYNVPFIMVPGRKMTLSSEEMAVFYKHFLDTNITRHTSYNRWDLYSNTYYNIIKPVVYDLLHAFCPRIDNSCFFNK